MLLVPPLPHSVVSREVAVAYPLPCSAASHEVAVACPLPCSAVPREAAAYPLPCSAVSREVAVAYPLPCSAAFHAGVVVYLHPDAPEGRGPPAAGLAKQGLEAHADHGEHGLDEDKYPVEYREDATPDAHQK